MNCRRAVTRVCQKMAIGVLFGAALAACGSTAPAASAQVNQLPVVPLLLLGEQHDAPEHQALQRETVALLSQRGQLAAVVMEMLEQGRSTTGLPRSASEAEVRQALQWSGDANAGWPWAVYGPVVMAAVAAGVPVLGGNLPRANMHTAMGDSTLDERLTPDALAQQQSNIREGHCNLLPEHQIAPLTRIQIARDRSLAQVAVVALKPGQTVLLVAGNGHVRRDLGVPRHLPAGVSHHVVMAQAVTANGVKPAAQWAGQADTVWATPPRPPTDHCTEMKKHMGR
ncbi:MAG: ChaN family lipoprotein [Hydrogenophaga sp.]|uniref:ChaN family lipoprotein n=1 Tax=Hydrogenophaga sp. TaxID=1904254 RepID=UPI001BBC890E|nr:ChaN family lipoprotein [Hydrogenophaga sp.]MBS3911022.1 ChaN family lipoprotein [Hydrogenophaga sp.]MDO9602976.1 ChaN family lipoprotein [Hydrogenophaga sp.]MDP2166377.1 ChaN family lipoprotein [Hydrogenophaga sp.]